MATSPRYLKRDLFELGYANQRMIDRVHGFWSELFYLSPQEGEFIESEDRDVPPLLERLVGEVDRMLQQFSEEEGLDRKSRTQAARARSLLLRAWNKYQCQWKKLCDHHSAQAQVSEKKCQNAPSDLQRPALAVQEWADYRASRTDLVGALGKKLSRWEELGSLLAQAEAYGDGGQPEILGEDCPVRPLQAALREARDSEPSLADVDVELSTSQTNFQGSPDSDLVHTKIAEIREAILDGLARHQTASDAQTPTGKRGKRSTEKGEARAKIIAALTQYHNYQNGSCLNQEPIVGRALARRAKVASSSVNFFFNLKFGKGEGRQKKGGYKNYTHICQDTQSLVHTLQLLNGEIMPSVLLPRRKPRTLSGG